MATQAISQTFDQPPYELDIQYQQIDLNRGLETGCTSNASNPILNCSFETGDLMGWILNDLATPVLPGMVVGNMATVGFGFFTTEATEGDLSFVTAFDGQEPGVIELVQDLTLTNSENITLTFDYRAAWDLETFGATMNRSFNIEVQPEEGGAPLQTTFILEAEAGTLVLDTCLLYTSPSPRD